MNFRLEFLEMCFSILCLVFFDLIQLKTIKCQVDPLAKT